MVEDEARGRDRVVAGEHGRDAALRGAVEARRAELLDASAALRIERDEQRAVLLLDRAFEQRLRHRAGARVQGEPAAAVVARGRDAPDPAAIDGAQPHVDLRAVVSSGKRSTTSATCTPGPVVDRRVPLAAVPVEAPAGDAAHERDDVRVVGEGEDDDRRAVGVAAQLDVGAFLDQLHPPSTVAARTRVPLARRAWHRAR